MKNTILTLTLVTLFFTSCDSLLEDPFEGPAVRTFVIPEGDHYANDRSIELVKSDVLSFTAKFDESAVYTFEEQGFQDSKNKLLGFSDCNSQHHENSARFAWQWYNDQLEIYAYCYVNGERIEKYVGVVQIGEVNKYEIRVTEDNYYFTLNSAEVTVPRMIDCQDGASYMLWPYFGGSIPAPHDVKIEITIDQP
jgi:hypothetical protein